MSMTRKHYVALAVIVHTISDKAERLEVCNQLCKMCFVDNPHFDESRFRHACEVEA